MDIPSIIFGLVAGIVAGFLAGFWAHGYLTARKGPAAQRASQARFEHKYF